MASATARIFTLLSTPLPLLQHRPSSSLLRLASRHSRLLLPHSARVSLLPSSLSLHFSYPLKPAQRFHSQVHSLRDDQFLDSNSHCSPSVAQHPWPEWLKFVGRVRSAGYSSEGLNVVGDELASADALSDDFARDATACMAFAQHNANALWSLSRKDIEVVVENGSPFLFKNCLDSSRRMKSFVNDCVLESDKPTTVDLMKFLLSYASMATISSEKNNMHNREVVEPSIRSLFMELSLINGTPPEPVFSGQMQNQFPGRYGQTRPFGRNIEMKRGDWICQRCNFMNFARNMKCLECEEPRPKRQLTGGEWECPQCDFFNYGRNAVCLRCDCKKPGLDSLPSTNSLGGVGNNNVNKYSDGGDKSKRLAENEEKAQRWFSKISQLENSSDVNTASADEDFPEIMPLRKGVNRFVVGTRKTPLERRLADEQYRSNVGNDGTLQINDFQMMGGDKTMHMKISGKLGETLGRESTAVSTNSGGSEFAKNESFSTTPSSASWKYGSPSNPSSAPFPEPTTGYTSQSSKTEEGQNEYERPLNQDGREREQAEKSERWFNRIAELHDVKDLPSAISNDDFPDVMPMRKGENRFIVSKKKDRSLTSPLYKRRQAMEQQAGSKDYVPFVPFPPDYFAKKDKQQMDGSDLTNNSLVESSTVSPISDQTGLSGGNLELPSGKNLQAGQVGFYSSGAGDSTNDNRTSNFFSGATTNVNQIHHQTNGSSVGGDSMTGNTVKTDLNGGPQPIENQNSIDPWKGRSLEGSAVKEPDPLDMSEEAKAERWFRRVAQIKDISELSQIPDEDFPSIMPMRKGVNRFVVSKRKTPLERRLTSSQYRKNLPIVDSDLPKKENESS
ncbi:hypothetical protein Ancab_015913 [Ancistrocladus abbreviatus]